MKTSCTRTIGRPNICPPIMAVTYSVEFAEVVVSWSARHAARLDVGALLLERRDQALPVEFGDEIVEADLRGRARSRRPTPRTDSAMIGRPAVARIGAERFGERRSRPSRGISMSVMTTIEGRRSERSASSASARRADRDHLVAGGLEHRRQHVAEERRSRRPAARVRAARAASVRRGGEPIVERQRQEMADVDDLGGLALDHRVAEHARPRRSPTSMSRRSSTMSTISSTTSPIERPPSENTRIGCAPSLLERPLACRCATAASDGRGTAPVAAVGHLDLAAVDLLEPRDQRQRHRLGLAASRRGTPAATSASSAARLRGARSVPRVVARRSAPYGRAPARCRSDR